MPKKTLPDRAEKPKLESKIWPLNHKEHPKGTHFLGAIHGGTIDFPDVTELVVLRWSPSKKFCKLREIAPLQRDRWVWVSSGLAPKCVEILGMKEENSASKKTGKSKA